MASRSASGRRRAAASSPADEATILRLSDEDIDRIVDALEDRILAELARRGGRVAGRY